MGPLLTSEWTVPAPPDTGTDRPIRAWRIGAGVVLALAGHLGLTWSGLALVRAALGGEYSDGGGILAFLVLLSVQAALVVCCALPGLLLLLFGDRGFGIGLLVGWSVGVGTLILLAYLTLSAARTA
jgi:hypothetical protein